MKRSLLVLPLLLFCSGCAAVVVGSAASAAAGYVWYQGSLKYTLEAPLPEVEQVTRQTFEELDLVGIDSVTDKLRADVTARMADGTKVRVRLKAVDFQQTAIKVRVGLLGDQAISEQIIRHIERHL